MSQRKVLQRGCESERLHNKLGRMCIKRGSQPWTETTSGEAVRCPSTQVGEEWIGVVGGIIFPGVCKFDHFCQDIGTERYHWDDSNLVKGSQTLHLHG